MPKTVDLADKLWKMKEKGVQWDNTKQLQSRKHNRFQIDGKDEASKIVVDSWGKTWDSETGEPSGTSSSHPHNLTSSSPDPHLIFPVS